MNASRERWVPWIANGMTLLLLAGAVQLTRTQLRSELRVQLVNRDAQILRAILQQQVSGISSSPDGDPLLTVLDASTLPELPGILGVRLFTEQGVFFTGLLSATNESDLPSPILNQIRSGQSPSQFHRTEAQSAATSLSLTGHPPVLEMVLPLPEASGGLAGIAQFYFDGSGLASEFEALDRSLQRQALLAFALAGSAISIALAFAFHRLSLANQLLEARTQRLLQANHELSLAAKTSAIGAVTSHLLHGLKNPLAGLQQFMSSQTGNAKPQAKGSSASPTTPPLDDAGWRDAAATARRMKSMIDGVMQVLSQEQGTFAYEVNTRELVQILETKFTEPATRAGVQWIAQCDAQKSLENRQANLVILILENLIGNAIQATPPLGMVSLSCTLGNGENPVFRVCDQGPGLPEQVRRHLFTPVSSTKEGGSGLGLALSHQLALHLGASLELVRSDESGTEFALQLSGQKNNAGGMPEASTPALRRHLA